jgi:uncharacterized protein
VTEQRVSGPEGVGAAPLGNRAEAFSFADTARDAQAATARIESTPRGVVAFVGRCRKGPVNEPIAVHDFAAFQQVFGGLWEHSMLSFAVEQFFEQGGAHALVVRVSSEGRAPTIDLPAGAGRLVLVGLCPGRDEFLRASVDHDGISNQDEDLFNLVVQRVRRRGSELVEAQETFRRVSILENSAREVTRMLLASKLVRVAGPAPARRPDITHGTDPRALIGYIDCNNDGEDGQPLSDYDLIGSESRRTGLFALEGGPQFNFLCIAQPEGNRDLGMSVLVVGARFCRRHHAMLLVDPPVAWDTTPRALAAVRDWPFHSADALMFFPRITALNRLTGKQQLFAPSAAAAALIVRDDQAREQLWREPEEPALLRPGAQPVLWVDRYQRQLLAHLGVNCLRATRTPARDETRPCTLAGEAAASGDARWLGTRRLQLELCASIERGTRWVAVEGNTHRTRERVARQVENFLREHAEAGAFAGRERNHHYFVLCDERLNGPAEQAHAVFRLVFGYQAVHAPARLTWLVEHRPAASSTRPISLNQLAALELS